MRAILAPRGGAPWGGRQNGRVTDTAPGSPPAAVPDPRSSAANAARIAARYPSRRTGRLVAGLALAVAAVGLGWLLFTALFHANPPVAGQVQSFRVTGDADVVVVLRVDRPDPAVRARCTVIAQSEDHRRVGELVVEVPPGSSRIVDLTLTVRTLARATSASLDGCAPAS